MGGERDDWRERPLCGEHIIYPRNFLMLESEVGEEVKEHGVSPDNAITQYSRVVNKDQFC